MWFVRVNMTDLSYKVEEVPEAYKHLGGRGLTSYVVADEVPPLAHPLGPNNKLVLAPGIVPGTAASTSARLSCGAKSPLTGGIKESNAGSSFAADMAVLGIKALIIEGQPEKNGQYAGLDITWDEAAGKPKIIDQVKEVLAIEFLTTLDTMRLKTGKRLGFRFQADLEE